MANERKLDFFIGGLLKAAKIKFTPNGSDNAQIKKALKSASKKGTGKAGYPEFTAKSKDFIIVVEDKADIDKQAAYDDTDNSLLMDTAEVYGYAENGAVHYAQEIIKKTSFKKVFAFGCSGDEKHYIIRPMYVDEHGVKMLDPVENFENFSPQNIEKYYREQVLGETPPDVKDKEEVLKKAKELHEHLRNYGQLGDKEKPLVVSAILLALQDDNFSIDQLRGNKTQTDGNKIYNAINNYLQEVDVKPDVKRNKVLEQFLIVKNGKILSQYDERLEETPIKFFTKFLKEHILDAVKKDRKEDILGEFYGEFMRYGGGDGQTLGVILTPPHITELFCELVDIKHTDKVFDPCCGTGGFLIAAMHLMMAKAKTKAQIDKIKKDKLHGIEIREQMFSIATTNMILRGDGKSNLENNDFLKQPIKELRKKKYNVGLMNPPYSQGSKESPHLYEICFIEHLLDGMANNARCLVIVPQSTMVGKTKIEKQIKERILQSHTLEGVITLNKETFYGVGTNPCIAIFTAHQAHNKNKHCKFINFEDDGFIVRKHVGLSPTERAKSQKIKLLDCWLHGATADSKFMVSTTIEASDEWLHSFYYFNDEIPKPEEFEKTMANYLTFEFNMIMQGREYLFTQNQE